MATFENLSKQWTDSLLSKKPAQNSLLDFSKLDKSRFSVSELDDSDLSQNKLLPSDTSQINGPNKLLKIDNTAKITNITPNYDVLLNQYEKERRKKASELGESSPETWKPQDDLDNIKINKFLFDNGYDLNDVNFENLTFDSYSKVADQIKDEQKKQEWLNLGHMPLMSRQFRGRSEGLREFGNNMNNIQKQVYDLRNQFQPPISPYNQQQISPDEYQKQRQQKWGELPPISSSAYDKATKPYTSEDEYTAFLKRASAGRKKVNNGIVDI